MENKTSGDKFMEHGALFGRLMANAEHFSEHPSREGCLKLAEGVLALTAAVGLGDLIAKKDSAK